MSEENNQPESIRESMLAVLQESESTDTESESTGEQSTASTENDQSTDTEATSTNAGEGSGESGNAETIEAPEHWSEDDQAIFANLPDEAKNKVLDIEKNLQSGFTQKTEELAQQRKRYEGFDQVVDQYHAGSGVDRATFVQSIVQTLPTVMQGYVALQRDPLGTLMNLAKTYNVEEKLSDSLAGIDFSDPSRSLENENAILKQQLQNAQNGSVQSQNAAGAQMIKDFAEEKTDDGALKHPDFEAVKPIMGGLMAADRSLSMEDAYSKAIWAGPNRDKLLESERSTWDAERKEQNQGKVGEARRRASQQSNAGKSSSTNAATKEEKVPENIGDALRQTLAEMESEQE